jgi:hypothetical protein
MSNDILASSGLNATPAPDSVRPGVALFNLLYCEAMSRLPGSWPAPAGPNGEPTDPHMHTRPYVCFTGTIDECDNYRRIHSSFRARWITEPLLVERVQADARDLPNEAKTKENS